MKETEVIAGILILMVCAHTAGQLKQKEEKYLEIGCGGHWS